jgi:hypothetical protein
VAEAGPNAVASFGIAREGKLTGLSTKLTGQIATCWITADGDTLYASNTGSATVSAYRDDGSGELTALGDTSTDAGPVDATVSSDGKFLYVETGGASASLMPSGPARTGRSADQGRRRSPPGRVPSGAQQRLVSLALQLRAAQQTLPPELSRLRAELGRVEAGLEGTLAELREYARGVHPAILTDGGLAPALKALARRFGLPLPEEDKTKISVPPGVFSGDSRPGAVLYRPRLTRFEARRPLSCHITSTLRPGARIPG